MSYRTAEVRVVRAVLELGVRMEGVVSFELAIDEILHLECSADAVGVGMSEWGWSSISSLPSLHAELKGRKIGYGAAVAVFRFHKQFQSFRPCRACPNFFIEAFHILPALRYRLKVSIS